MTTISGLAQKSYIKQSDSLDSLSSGTGSCSSCLSVKNKNLEELASEHDDRKDQIQEGKIQSVLTSTLGLGDTSLENEFKMQTCFLLQKKSDEQKTKIKKIISFLPGSKGRETNLRKEIAFIKNAIEQIFYVLDDTTQKRFLNNNDLLSNLELYE